MWLNCRLETLTFSVLRMKELKGLMTFSKLAHPNIMKVHPLANFVSVVSTQ